MRHHLVKLQAYNMRVYLKPRLTDEHKAKRIEWILSLIDFRSDGRQLLFKDHFNYIHVDEKWLYLMKDGTKTRLLPGMELLVNPKVQHKSHIEKIMYLTVHNLLDYVPSNT